MSKDIAIGDIVTVSTDVFYDAATARTIGRSKSGVVVARRLRANRRGLTAKVIKVRFADAETDWYFADSVIDNQLRLIK
jgi:hypothetical protein